MLWFKENNSNEERLTRFIRYKISMYLEIIFRKDKIQQPFLRFNFIDAQIKFSFTKNIDENINLWINKKIRYCTYKEEAPVQKS